MEEVLEPVAIYCRTSPHGSSSKDKKEATIEQQIELGQKWIQDNGITDYKFYIDEHISGAKVNKKNIKQNETEGVVDRPELALLLDDIKMAGIRTVWVWEGSRWARDDFLNAFIDDILYDNKIIIWEGDKVFDSSKPVDVLTRNLIHAFSSFEHEMIIARTTRGLYKAMNRGDRSFSNFFGYQRTTNRDINEYLISKPISEDLELVKKAYEMYSEGKTINDIVRTFHDDPTLDEKKLQKLSTKWHRILNHKEYTGMALTREGLAIEKCFDEGDKDIIYELKLDKYWVKSRMYNVELISREMWINTKIKLLKNRGSKGKFKLVDVLSTGIIKCHFCGDAYFYHETSSGKSPKKYPYYTHKNGALRRRCKQKPKTITIHKVDTVFQFVYWLYWYNIVDIQKIAADAEQQKRNAYSAIEANIKKYESTNQKIYKVNKQLSDKMLEMENLELEIHEIIEMRAEYKKKLRNNEEQILVLKKSLSSIIISEDIGITAIETKLKDFEKADSKKKRELLLDIIITATIYDKKLIIEARGNIFFFVDLADKTLLPRLQINFENRSLKQHRQTKQNEEVFADWLLAKEYHIEPVYIEPIDATPEIGNAFTFREYTETILKSFGINFTFPDGKAILYSLSPDFTQTVFSLPFTK